MGNFKQCPNGHYYDQSLPECPYCSPSHGGIDRSVSFGASMGVDSYDIKTANPMSYSGSSVGTVAPGFGGGYSSYSSQSISPVGDYNDGNTRPPEDNDPTKTTIIRRHRPGTERGEKAASNEAKLPVVGWLVAVDGPYCGRSFELHHGYNYIGSKSGDIVLEKEKAISREKNFSVLYSEKNKSFYIGAGQSTNVVYVNGDVLFAGSNSILNAYDLIEIGDSDEGVTKFRFVPFCGEKFNW